MKDIKKIGIKEFCAEYIKRIPQMQENYIEDNLVITPYLPFVRKDALADILVKRSTYEYENYTKEDGTVGSRPTDKIKVNSVVQYILFCRVIIENYTNLTVETEGFYEEYDALKECGLLDKLMVSTETRASLIPMDEIAELRALIDFKQKDAIFNATVIHNYIGSQVERFRTLLGVTLKPVMDKIAENLENMTKQDVEKLSKKVDKVMKRVK